MVKSPKSPGTQGVNAQPCEARLDPQNILGNIHEGPGSGSCEPAVFCFPVRGGIPAGDHLGIAVRLGSVDFADILQESRTGFPVYFKGSFPSADNRLRDGNPGIVMAENACIFLVSRRVGGDFPKLQVITGEGWLKEHDAIFGIKTFFYAVQGTLCLSFLDADSRQHAEALGAR